MTRIITEDPPQLDKTKFPKALCKYVNIMLSKDPAKRRSVSHFLVIY